MPYKNKEDRNANQRKRWADGIRHPKYITQTPSNIIPESTLTCRVKRQGLSPEKALTMDVRYQNWHIKELEEEIARLKNHS